MAETVLECGYNIASALSPTEFLCDYELGAPVTEEVTGRIGHSAGFSHSGGDQLTFFPSQRGFPVKKCRLCRNHQNLLAISITTTFYYR